MSKPDDNGWICRHGAYVARPKRFSTKDGVELAYVTVRCRRKGEEGEWPLGSFATRRQMTDAFYDWLAERRRVSPSLNGDARMRDVIADYQEFVRSLGKRPATVQGRTYTSSQLDAFVAEWSDDLVIADFDDAAFGQYLKWLTKPTKTDEHGAVAPRYKAQTVENALIGARTFLRWAITQKYIAEAPKAPDFNVPDIEHAPLYAEDIDALIAAAEAPLNVMLKLLWLAGLRISEASTLRRLDLLEDRNLIAIRRHGDFVPKTEKSTRTIPVTQEMMAELVQLAGEDPLAAVFACPVKCRYHYWRHRFNKARKAAGLRHFTFHDLRRAVSDRFRSIGTPIDRYCKFMGHSAITGLRHYSVVEPGDLHADMLAALDASRTRTGK